MAEQQQLKSRMNDKAPHHSSQESNSLEQLAYQFSQMKVEEQKSSKINSARVMHANESFVSNT